MNIRVGEREGSACRGAGRPARRGIAVVAVVAVAALVAAGCGGGSSSSSSAPGVASDSITVGSHQPLTGPVAPGYSEIAPATKAMFDYINTTMGGVNGRKINYTYEDDAYNPTQTVSVVRKLVLQDNVFAILNGLGTPTHQQVLGFLNTEKVPDVFVASGCTCWNQTTKYPYTFGYQTNYTIEGRILGNYVKNNFAGQKVGYLLQNDDVGQGGQAGLDKELPASDVVSKQMYDVSALTGPLTNQMAALQAAGAKVVVMFSVPAATALALLAAALIGYHPQFVASSIDSDITTLTGLLQNYSKGQAGGSLLNGLITALYLPSGTNTSNPWIQLFKKIHDQYDASNPFDGNTIYGMAVGYSFWQVLQKAGKNLTRSTLVSALNSANLTGPGLLPLTFSSTDHRGYQGEQMATFEGTSVNAMGPVYQTTETGPISTYTKGQPPPPAGF
jgi:ABC-type branched-subunit amino acid transport system substrate-binding protein